MKVRVNSYYVKASDQKKIYGSFTVIYEDMNLELKHCSFIMNRKSKTVVVDTPYKIVRDEEDKQVKVPVFNFLGEGQNAKFRQDVIAAAKEYFSSITVMNSIYKMAEHKAPPMKKKYKNKSFTKNEKGSTHSSVQSTKKTSWISKR